MTKSSLWRLKGFYHQDDKWFLVKLSVTLYKSQLGRRRWKGGTAPAPPLWERSGLTYQEGAEEDERHEVEIGKIAAAFFFGEAGERVAGSVAQAGQHDLVPGFPCGAPADGEGRG